ncbi:MAG: homogentisate 1,2-dioxygenase, partial [Pseudomonadota bacterium]|nr:homogentisate 1,2-dioxygenase [Pseudomonadota bacterium]
MTVDRAIPVHRSEGMASRQAHADLPAGTYERELGREGFRGPSTEMHHRHPPTGWTHVDGPLRPRAFDTSGLEPDPQGPWAATPLLGNDSLALRWWRGGGHAADLFRNADGDDLLFLHGGIGHLYCDYGHLAVEPGDYVLLPRGTLWRIESDGPVSALLIEATGARYCLPDRGLAGNHAIFDPSVLDCPRIDDDFLDQQGESETRARVKRNGTFTTITYPFNPLDAVGWHGDLAPVRINWRDIRPLMSHRYHVPPSAHATFVSERFLVSTFVPRPLESAPGTLGVPFYHSNEDYDEVIFYHLGDFFSRDAIQPRQSRAARVGPRLHRLSGEVRERSPPGASSACRVGSHR